MRPKQPKPIPISYWLMKIPAAEAASHRGCGACSSTLVVAKREGPSNSCGRSAYWSCCCWGRTVPAFCQNQTFIFLQLENPTYLERVLSQSETSQLASSSTTFSPASSLVSLFSVTNTPRSFPAAKYLTWNARRHHFQIGML